MKLLFATTNPHKARELGEMLGPLGIEVCSLADVAPHLPEPVEDADTFEGNARIKAMAYSRALGMPCLADDSGLEVDALGGAPGVHSARYAGVGDTREERDRANNDKLIAELRKLGDVDRSARFVCALCLVDAEGQVSFEARGTHRGVITDQARGDNGFGYDPHFYLPDVGKTDAELSDDERNARSHRGAATRALVAWLATGGRLA
ncbi:MAG: RdgB/HAM1 family non-canonical purine NTP pyrophosphatase [Polyangiaceae bacterium]|nr:RdgB/HAM1 family non-canonical purine NTP pyrophosphatase [Polyangiaceae bacterium]